MVEAYMPPTLSPFRLLSARSTFFINLHRLCATVYRLLPPTIGFHGLRHLARPWALTTGFHRLPPPCAPVGCDTNDISNKDTFAIEEVVGSSWDKKRKKVRYLVMWEGYREREVWTEEPYQHFPNGGLEALRKFHRENPAVIKLPRLSLEGKRKTS